MSLLTTEQLALYRSQPHRTKLNLSIFQPTTAFTCRITGSVARNDYQIPYYNPSGSTDAVEEGMTLLVGTTAGDEDVGRVRIRDIDGSQITVAENSDIDWQNGLYLTVLRYWEVWPIFPRIISDPSNAENTIWYKDYDVAYTNQNTIMGAFPCAGPHRAAFLDDGQVNIYYTATGTSHVADVSMGYEWFFEGATVTGSNALTPGYVTYDTPGHYVTRLRVTGSNGTIDDTYRYVSIYDRPENGTNTPILSWGMGNIDGSRSGGGYTVSITVHELIDVHEGDVVVLFGESWYGEVEGTIGGNAVGNSDIFFVGHILKGSIEYNYKHSDVTFEVGSITQWMKEQEGFSISVESVPSPSYWYQLYDMDINKAVQHYLKWQSTVLSITDVQSLIDDRPIQYFDSDRSSLYDAIDNLVRGTILGGVTSDMQGKVWLEHGAHAFPNLASQTYSSPIMDLRKQDWVGTPRIDEQLSPATSFIDYTGMAFSGVSTGTFAPLISNAPGTAPLYRGKQDRKVGLAPKSQVELNEITGNMLANSNYQWPRITHQIPGAYRNLDIAPQETVRMLVDAEDTTRGITINDSYMLDSIAWAYDPKNQLFNPTSTSFKSLVTGSAGQTVPIPPTPDDGGFANPSPNFPYIPNLYWPAVYGPPSSTGTSSSTGTAAVSLDYISINVNTVGNIVKYSGLSSYSIGVGSAVEVTSLDSGIYWVYASVTGEIPSAGGYAWVTIKCSNTAVYPNTYGQYPFTQSNSDQDITAFGQVIHANVGYIYVDPGDIYVDRLVNDYSSGNQTPVQLLVNVFKIG